MDSPTSTVSLITATSLPWPQTSPTVEMNSPSSTRPSSPHPRTYRRLLQFPKGYGKTLAQLCDWFLPLLEQHPSLEPVIKEDKQGFIWLKNRVLATEPCSQLLGLLEGDVASKAATMLASTPQNQTCVANVVVLATRAGSISRLQDADTVLAPICSPAAWKKSRLTPRFLRTAATARGTQCQLPSLLCRPYREPQDDSTHIRPTRVVFRPAPPPQYNAWMNGTPSLSAFPALPPSTAQTPVRLPLPGTAASTQPGTFHVVSAHPLCSFSTTTYPCVTWNCPLLHQSTAAAAASPPQTDPLVSNQAIYKLLKRHVLTSFQLQPVLVPAQPSPPTSSRSCYCPSPGPDPTGLGSAPAPASLSEVTVLELVSKAMDTDVEDKQAAGVVSVLAAM
ncbi:hypothetical protein E2C01_038240 [Portunus trituberculatus]|uniref:Uncharacterized protein n=1 Tax=Portunus trituberculatus TaxID=210409 RepID=A0A5B7FJF6_PORTR|nr:hypothetical protein [Portunus trituberculatus]